MSTGLLQGDVISSAAGIEHEFAKAFESSPLHFVGDCKLEDEPKIHVILPQARFRDHIVRDSAVIVPAGCEIVSSVPVDASVTDCKGAKTLDGADDVQRCFVEVPHCSSF